MSDRINDALQLILSTDAYKLGHKDQYPNKTEFIFANLTPRKSFDKDIGDKIYVFGLDYIVKKLYSEWDMKFFSLKKKEFQTVVELYQEKISIFLGKKKDEIDIDHLKQLWTLNKLPLVFKYKKGESNIGEPIMVWWNTNRKFYWLPTYLESYLLSRTWPIITSSTISYHAKKSMNEFFKKTSDDKLKFLVDYQGHDFSMRGMSGIESGILSGIGHLSNFSGTDTLPAYLEYEKFYGKKLNPIMSVVATEHSVMSSRGKEGEFELYKDLIKMYKNGIVSIVSDTYDFWNVIGNYLPNIRDEIKKRNGKIVIRPDSGDAIEILFGNKNATNKWEKIGLLSSLSEIFGHSINNKGYKQLDNSIGVIYGDAINLSKIKSILKEAEKNKWASINIVFGMGGSTYQRNTRDTLGFSIKATHMIVDGKDRPIYKNPKTDEGMKTSLYGFPTLKGKETIKTGVIYYIKKYYDFKLDN